MSLSEHAETFRLASISARIVGALQRRLGGRKPIAGDDYVLGEGKEFLRSLRPGGRAISGEKGAYLSMDATSALPAVVTTLSEQPEARAISPGFSEWWERKIDLLMKVLESEQADPERLAIAIRFFLRLSRILTDQLERDGESIPPETECNQ